MRAGSTGNLGENLDCGQFFIGVHIEERQHMRSYVLSKCDDLRILSIVPVENYADNKLSKYETAHTGGSLWPHIALICHCMNTSLCNNFVSELFYSKSNA